MQGWTSQREHLQTHDLFFSAVYGDKGRGLIDIGFYLTGEFTVAENAKKEARCIPSFTLYNNEHLIFVDILEPGDITEETVERVSDYNRLDMESVEKYLKQCEFTESHLTNGNIENYDHLFLMDKDQYNRHRAGTPEQRERISII